MQPMRRREEQLQGSICCSPLTSLLRVINYQTLSGDAALGITECYIDHKLVIVIFYRRSYLLLQLNHLLLLEDEVAEAILERVGHQSVSVVGAHLEKTTHVTKGLDSYRFCSSTAAAPTLLNYTILCYNNNTQKDSLHMSVMTCYSS